MSEIPAAKIALYDKLLATNPQIKRKGKTNPYTSHNGHMFTHLAPPERWQYVCPRPRSKRS